MVHQARRSNDINTSYDFGLSIFGKVFREKVKALGIEEVVSSRKSPCQNAFREKAIGTLRREYTDHVIALS